ncbi:MAG: hypothetical protein ABIZ18_14955 [Caldimonas sp.]
MVTSALQGAWVVQQPRLHADHDEAVRHDSNQGDAESQFQSAFALRVLGFRSVGSKRAERDQYCRR